MGASPWGGASQSVDTTEEHKQLTGDTSPVAETLPQHNLNKMKIERNTWEVWHEGIAYDVRIEAPDRAVVYREDCEMFPFRATPEFVKAVHQANDLCDQYEYEALDDVAPIIYDTVKAELLKRRVNPS